MAEEDFRVRHELAADGSLFDGYHPRMRSVHDANAARLSAIFESLGWPGERQVGKQASEAAWLVVEHAIAQPAFQRHALALLQAAVARADAPPLQAAMLGDRIRTLEGRLQLYGTQFDWDASGQLSPLPIEDAPGVDARRQEIGLGPLPDAVRHQRAAAARQGERPPENWSARQGKLETWCREVGWRA
jgi:hypothetical protein